LTNCWIDNEELDILIDDKKEEISIEDIPF
jgi:hypothetical protein